MGKLLTACLVATAFAHANYLFPRTNAQNPRACVQAANCHLVMGDAYRAFLPGHPENPHHIRDYEAALNFMQKYQKFKKCGMDVINRNCQPKVWSCESALKSVLLEIGYRFHPWQIISHCDYYTFTYTMFLCRNIRGWWKNITDIAEPGFAECAFHSIPCAHIIRYNELHLSFGVTEFPPTWQQHLQEQIDYNNMFGQNRRTTLQQPRQGMSDLGVPTLISIFEDKDERLLTEEPNTCDSATYVIGLNDFLANGQFCACCESANLGRGQGQNVFNTTPTCSWVGAGNSQACGRAEYFGKDVAPYGQLIVGMEFKTTQELGQDIVVGGRYLCSGLEQWVGAEKYNGVVSRNVHRVQCPPQSALCSMDVHFGNTKKVTNVRIGCCHVQEAAWHSTISIQNPTYRAGGDGVESELVQSAFILESPRDHISYSAAHRCERFQFIDRIDFKARFLNRKGGSPSPGAEQRHLVVMVLEFTCSNFDKSSQAPLSTELYKTKAFAETAFADIPLGEGTCSGFLTGGNFAVEKNGVNVIYAYNFNCSTGGTISARYNSAEHNTATGTIYADVEPGGGSFSCPARHAICGVVAGGAYLGSLSKYWGADRGFNTSNFISTHGYRFQFMCCPVPAFIEELDCGSEGLTLELQDPDPPCTGAPQTNFVCQITGSLSRTYSETGRQRAATVTNAAKIVTDSFRISELDKYKAMAAYPRRKLGPVLKSTVNTGEGGATRSGRAAEGSGHRRVKREPFTWAAFFARAGEEASKAIAAGTMSTAVSASAGASRQASEASLEGRQGQPFALEFSPFRPKTEEDMKTQAHSVEAEQAFIFKDPVLSCGAYEMRAGMRIRFVGPPRRRPVSIHLEFVDGDRQVRPNDFPVTISTTADGLNYGHGLHINLPRADADQDIRWENYRAGIREKFQAELGQTNASEALRDESIWLPYRSSVVVSANATIKANHFYMAYRIVGVLGAPPINTTLPNVYVFTSTFVVLQIPKEFLDVVVNVIVADNTIPLANVPRLDGTIDLGDLFSGGGKTNTKRGWKSKK